MKRYKAFDLLVERSRRGYRARALDSPAGEGDARIPRSLAAEMERLTASLGSSAHGEEDGQTARKVAERLGARLFRAIFTGEVGRRLEICLDEAADRERGLCLRLRLTGVPEASRWPWEFLFHPRHHRFLALSAETPIVRYPEMPQRCRPLATELPLVILVIVAAPRDRPSLNAEREWERIEQALDPLAQAKRVHLELLRPASLPALEERLRREPVHVLHFIGHAAFDAAHGEGVLQLENRHGRAMRVTGDQLGALLLDHPSLRLVVLNVCEGALHGEADAFGGVAQRLLQQRIPAVVAMQREISNRAAVTFASRFYTSLAAGEPVEAAVAEARRAMDHEGHGIEWGSPVLYLRSLDGMLFDLESAEAIPSFTTGEDPNAEASPIPARRGARLFFLCASLLAVLLALAGGLALVVRGGRELAGEARVAHAPAPRLSLSELLQEGGKPGDQGRAAPPREEPPSSPKPEPAPFRRPTAVPPSPSQSPRCPSPKSTEILFSWIPRGSFEMGSNHGDPNERPAHRVTIAKSFCMGVYEITVGQWNEVMGSGAPAVRNDWLMPKVGVSWYQAHEFLDRINAQNPGYRFFLPSEAQWEYAARAGSALGYGFSDVPDELYKYANCLSKGEHSDGYDGASPACSFLPNAWRLYDMQGNVWEWVEDRYGEYDAAPAVDPTGPAVGDARVRRGGSFRNKPDRCRSSTRESSRPEQHLYNLGFRIAADPVH